MLFEGKNVLVTGATGLIGYNLVGRLLKEGVVKVYATGRSIIKLKSTFDEYSDNKSLVLIAHDAATTLPEELKDIDYIFHAAGPMERAIVLNRPVDVILPNVIGVIKCLDFLKDQEKQTGRKGRLIAFSSVTVYDNPTKEDYAATENNTNYALSLDAPTACYAESKRMMEVVAKAYSKQYGVDTVIARFSTIYGYTKNVPNTAFFEFINKARKGEDIVLNGNCFPKRDNIYIEDAIQGLIVIALKGHEGESYNISSNGEKGNYAAVDEIASVVASIMAELEGKSAVIVHAKPSLSRPPGITLNNKKLVSLGWSVNTSFFDGVKETIMRLR